MINIIIADDHAMIREGIKQLLEMEGDFQIIAEAGDGEECLSLLEEVTADVLLLDINMPKKNGLEVLESLKAKKNKSKIKVIILTVHNETEYLLKAVDIGVDGYILKNSGSSELRKAIYNVYKGNIYIQHDLIPALNSRLIHRDVDKERIEQLTRRELEVLIKVASGMSNKEIATTLTISERTVKNHISNIFKKIQVIDRTQAAVFAIKNNLIELF